MTLQESTDVDGAQSTGDEAAGETRGRILVADDSEYMRRSMSRTLTRLGYEVSAVWNGDRARAMLCEHKFDVMVSDIHMPGMDGIELLQMIRELDLDLPVVLVTGEPALNTAVQAIEHGVFHYFIKPFETKEFGEVIDRAVQKCRQHRALMSKVDPAAQEQVTLESSFEHALGNMWMAFQPIVRADQPSVYGNEALLRSTVSDPLAILRAGEQLERLPEIARATQAKVVEVMVERPEAGFLFYNIHPKDLEIPGLLDKTSPLAQLSRRVVLEITERASLATIVDVRSRIQELKALGFRIALDDLGAGYASLNSFTELEPDLVKLDMALVRGVDTDRIKQRMIRSMTEMCHDMGILVVAEGVETAAERDALLHLMCDLFQGFYFARPGAPFPEVNW